jgi:hypothetical protein
VIFFFLHIPCMHGREGTIGKLLGMLLPSPPFAQKIPKISLMRNCISFLNFLFYFFLIFKIFCFYFFQNFLGVMLYTTFLSHNIDVATQAQPTLDFFLILLFTVPSLILAIHFHNSI